MPLTARSQILNQLLPTLRAGIRAARLQPAQADDALQQSLVALIPHLERLAAMPEHVGPRDRPKERDARGADAGISKRRGGHTRVRRVCHSRSSHLGRREQRRTFRAGRSTRIRNIARQRGVSPSPRSRGARSRVVGHDLVGQMEAIGEVTNRGTRGEAHAPPCAGQLRTMVPPDDGEADTSFPRGRAA